MAFDPDAMIQRSTDPVETTVGQEVVLMSLASGECFGLGDTGSEVWRLLATPTTLTAVTAALSAAYDAPAEVIQADVAELLDEMVRRKLISVGA